MRFFLLTLFTIACFATSAPETTQDAECAGCSDFNDDFNACLLNQCLSDCISGGDTACITCAGEKCLDEINDVTTCEYESGCQDLETCSACADEEADQQICMMDLVYLNQCGFTIDTTEDPTAWDWSCINDKCGSTFEATIGCAYTNCDQGSYDVWTTTSFCGDGSSCDGDCTQISGGTLTFGECDGDDEDNTSFSAVCDETTSTVTVSQYPTIDCSGTAIVSELSQGQCTNLEMDGTSNVYKYNWFGACGAEAYVAPSSTSTLLVTLAFVVSFVLY